jgi:hypothetical protein
MQRARVGILSSHVYLCIGNGVPVFTIILVIIIIGS